ncbi:serine hydrolase domain-containing protein [Winogradskyella flava]|uniref:serine hydrolase domain-containing protein n=1 Tax=Winogradskyella flava TaxID=1884876 RepID=UPI00249248AC|nr:serine hydrolase domain-containing protein [Winogradskyella flava]
MKNISLLVLVCLCNIIAGQNDTSKSINKILENYKDQPGVSIGVFKDGKILHHAITGYSNLDYDIKTNKETVYDVTSVSKQFTAACIMLLENEGKLSLDDSIQKYIPDFPSYAQGEITIANLLYHTSGLRDYIRILYAKGVYENNAYNNDDIAALLKNQNEINFEPGTNQSYSSSNYVLLSLIIERVSGMSLGAFAKEKIFTPLGMEKTLFYEDEFQVIKNRAIGYTNSDAGFITENYFNSTITGDGGLYTTVGDLFKWNENFKNSKIGNSTFIKRLISNGKLKNGRTIRFAAGLVASDEASGNFTIGAVGQRTGFSGMYYNFPELDVTFVVLSNNAGVNVWEILDALRPLFIENRSSQTAALSAQQEPIKPYSVATKTLKTFTGSYFNPSEGYSRYITLNKDKLYYKRSIDGAGTELIPIGKQKFTFREATYFVIDFKKLKKGGQQLNVTIGQDDPITMNKYIPKTYSENELKKFEGTYYSAELDVEYTLKSTKNTLKAFIGTRNLVTVHPLMKNIFNDIHFGYFKFEESSKGDIVSFTINDETTKNIAFVKKQNS